MSSTLIPRRYFWVLFVAVFMAGGFFAASHSFAQAGSMPITGYAWSSNVGWISFSGTALDGASYGVSEDKTTGALSGYAWSSNIGWISFNVPDAGHPAPSVALSTGKVSGWIRACAAFTNKNACSGTLDANSGGWDGWIALAGTAGDGTAYGMTQSSTCAWTGGYAWGSDGIGAISASGTATDGSRYGVTGNDVNVCSGTPPSCPNGANNPPTCTTFSPCANGANNPPTCTTFSPCANGANNPPTCTTCTAPLGWNGSACVPPPPSLPPTVSITATPARVNSTATTNNTVITWSSDATSCTVTKNGAFFNSSLNSPVGGVSQLVTSQTVYGIDCVNDSGTHTTASVTVNILPVFQEF